MYVKFDAININDLFETKRDPGLKDFQFILDFEYLKMQEKYESLKKAYRELAEHVDESESSEEESSDEESSVWSFFKRKDHKEEDEEEEEE